MIEVQSMELNPQKKEAKVFLMSDTKDEVTPTAEIVGLPEGYTIAPFSKIMTAAKKVGIMQSNGNWKW